MEGDSHGEEVNRRERGTLLSQEACRLPLVKGLCGEAPDMWHNCCAFL